MSVALRAAVLLFVSIQAFAGTPGSFRGILYKGTETKPGWWYVAGKNNSLRLVYTAKAVVSYADDIRPEDRKKVPARALAPGVEVRVTAEQDGRGWRASEIEILNLKGVGQSASKRHSGAHP